MIFKTPEGQREILARYNEILALWPKPYQHLTIPTAYGNTFVIASGPEDGAPVVLLHGSSTNSAMWIGDAAVLGRAHRVYAVDIIGEPGNSAETRPGNNGDEYAKWLCNVLDGLNLRQTALIGNSLGGWMALCLAAYAPERVSQLVMIAPAGLASIRATFAMKMIAMLAQGEKGHEKIHTLIYGDIAVPPEALAFGKLLSAHYIPRTIDIAPLKDETLRRLTMPVLFFGGDQDQLINIPRSADKLRRCVPHADIRVLKGMPHALINLGGEIAAFLEKEEDA